SRDPRSGRRREMTEPNRPRLVVATPYSEGSILAIARAAAEAGQLVSFLTSVRLPRLEAIVRKVPTRYIRRRVRGAVNRRSFATIAADQVVSVAVVMEVMHLIARRLPRSQALAARMMYAAKRSFDRRA